MFFTILTTVVTLSNPSAVSTTTTPFEGTAVQCWQRAHDYDRQLMSEQAVKASSVCTGSDYRAAQDMRSLDKTRTLNPPHPIIDPDYLSGVHF